MYKLIRPPKSGNCQVLNDDDEIEDFSTSFFKIMFCQGKPSVGKLKKNKYFADSIKYDPWNFKNLEYYDVSTQERFLIYNICGAYCCTTLKKKLAAMIVRKRS